MVASELSPPTPPFKRRLLAWLVLVLGTAAIYAQVGTHEFVNYDDDRYVTANPAVQGGLTAEGAAWALTANDASNWHPVTWLSHMLDVEVFGLEPGGHHGVSVAWHVATALLVLQFLVAATGRLAPAFVVAALFAWHPQRVESVAWVAERKDVLSGFFFALTLVAHGAYARRGGALRYLGVVAALALGLASKPMLVTTPFVLLLLDVWPLRRDVTWTRRIVEKLPLFGLVIASATVTFLVQDASGATALLPDLPLGLRLQNALAALAFYGRQFVWPLDLACLYPHAALTSSAPDATAAALALPAMLGGLLLVVAALAAWRSRFRGPAFVGLAWALGMLVPVIGVVQVGFQSHADRYTYLPSIGLLVALVYPLVHALERRHDAGRARALLVGAVALVLVGCAWTSRAQVATWRDAPTLWDRALAVTERNYVAHNNRGRLFASAGDVDRARHHFEEALRIRPGTPPDREAATTRYNLAGLHVGAGRFDEAAHSLALAVELDPESAAAHGQLGRVLAELGDDAGAERHLRRALELLPGELENTARLAELLATSPDDDVRRGREALRLARRVCATTRHENALHLATLAAAHAELREFETAVRWQGRALQLAAPNDRPEMQERLLAFRRAEPWRRTR